MLLAVAGSEGLAVKRVKGGLRSAYFFTYLKKGY